MLNKQHIWKVGAVDVKKAKDFYFNDGYGVEWSRRPVSLDEYVFMSAFKFWQSKHPATDSRYFSLSRGVDKLQKKEENEGDEGGGYEVGPLGGELVQFYSGDTPKKTSPSQDKQYSMAGVDVNGLVYYIYNNKYLPLIQNWNGPMPWEDPEQLKMFMGKMDLDIERLNIDLLRSNMNRSEKNKNDPAKSSEGQNVINEMTQEDGGEGEEREVVDQTAPAYSAPTSTSDAPETVLMKQIQSEEGIKALNGIKDPNAKKAYELLMEAMSSDRFQYSDYVVKKFAPTKKQPGGATNKVLRKDELGRPLGGTLRLRPLREFIGKTMFPDIPDLPDPKHPGETKTNPLRWSKVKDLFKSEPSLEFIFKGMEEKRIPNKEKKKQEKEEREDKQKPGYFSEPEVQHGVWLATDVDGEQFTFQASGEDDARNKATAWDSEVIKEVTDEVEPFVPAGGKEEDWEGVRKPYGTKEGKRLYYKQASYETDSQKRMRRLHEEINKTFF